MKYDWDKLEKIGEGGEKEVYKNPDNPENALLRFKNRIPEREIKAKFYFSKLLNLLFPNNIPDVHRVGTSDRESLAEVEFKSFSEEHKTLNKSMRGFAGEARSAIKERDSKKAQEAMRSFFKLKKEAGDELSLDPQYSLFSRKMEELGVEFDGDPINFGHDKAGNLIYIDNDFRPWRVDDFVTPGKLSVNYFYNKDKLLRSIENLNESDKQRAITYLQRIEELAEEDLRAAVRELGKSN